MAPTPTKRSPIWSASSLAMRSTSAVWGETRIWSEPSRRSLSLFRCAARIRSTIDFLVWADTRPRSSMRRRVSEPSCSRRPRRTNSGVSSFWRRFTSSIEPMLTASMTRSVQWRKRTLFMRIPALSRNAWGCSGGRIAHEGGGIARCIIESLRRENPHRHHLFSQVRRRYDGAVHRGDHPRARLPRTRAYGGAPRAVRSETRAHRRRPIPSLSLRARGLARGLRLRRGAPGRRRSPRRDLRRAASRRPLRAALAPAGAPRTKLRRGARPLGGPERGDGRACARRERASSRREPSRLRRVSLGEERRRAPRREEGVPERGQGHRLQPRPFREKPSSRGPLGSRGHPLWSRE